MNNRIIDLTKFTKLINLTKYNKIIMMINHRGLGIGDWGLGPIPNPQSPIPNIYYYSN